MRKNVLKAGAAVMAAVMIMMVPMTAKAEGGYKNVVAKDSATYNYDYIYTLPIYDYIEKAITERNIRFDADAVDIIINQFNVDITVPAGYEAKGITMVLDKERDGGYGWNVDADNSSQWVKMTGEDFYDGYTIGYKFTVDYNGVSYPDCAFYSGINVQSNYFCAVVPKGYNGDIPLKIWGVKLVDGKLVNDENSWLVYYLNGDETSAEQTATEQQTTPSYQGNAYTTKSGDSLSKIAKELYGDKAKWKDIYELNKDLIKDPNVIYANMQLILP